MQQLVAASSAYVLMCLLGGGPVKAERRSPVDFKKHVRPILAKYCFRCHNDKKKAGDVALHNLGIDFVNGKDAETWHDALNKLNRGEMPPEKALQPTVAEREVVVDWLTAELKRAAAIKRSSGGQIVLRRLTRYDYANTMRDLLGVNFNFADDLPPESTSSDGFRNNGSVLGISPLQIEYYLKAARLGLSKAIVTGDKPRIYTHRATKGGRARKDKTPRLIGGNQVPPRGVFRIKLSEFPRNGEFLIRVKAAARTAKGGGYPALSVAIGPYGAQPTTKVVGKADIRAPSGAPRVYEFRGRIESFPRPPGQDGALMVSLTHLATDRMAGGRKRRGRARAKTEERSRPRRANRSR